MQNAKLRDILHHNNTTLAVKLSTQVYNEHILVFWFLYALESYLLGVISKIISYELCVLLWVTYLSVLQLSHTWKGIITVLTSEDCCEDEIHSVQLLSCVWLCDPMHCSTPGFPVHHQLLELAQTHVHQVGNAIQPSHPVVPFSSCFQSFPASASFPMSQFFTSGGQSIGASASVLPVNIQDWFPLQLVGSPCSPRDSQVSSLAP